ncbi:MAG: nucleotidyl transferase AbiEii/AbiGii toxin family protein [Sulfuricellaceae bacterium]|nr:nucleotidyl transferase AbiEii/AbiGii toxin family protein [Sulfuricellaceae bacterium]
MFYLDLFRALEHENIRYVLIGGLALNIHGVERATMDIDLMLAMDTENLEAFCRAADSLGMTPLLPVTMKDFANPITLQRWVDERNLLSFSFRSQESSAPTVDILVHPKVAFDMAWARHLEKDLGSIHIRLAHIDDLIALKTGTGRQRDMSDVAALERLKTLRGE